MLDALHLLCVHVDQFFEKILEKLSFEANLSEKKTEIVNKQWVQDAIQSEIKPTDEKKFIL